MELRQITPLVLSELVLELQRDGVGPPTARKLPQAAAEHVRASRGIGQNQGQRHFIRALFTRFQEATGHGEVSEQRGLADRAAEEQV